MKIRLDSWKQQVLRCCKCYFTPSTFSKAVHLFLPLNGQGSKARLELSGRAGRQDTPHWGGAVGDGGALGDLWSPESQVQRKYKHAPHPHRSASGGRGGRQQLGPGSGHGDLVHPAPSPPGRRVDRPLPGAPGDTTELPQAWGDGSRGLG